MPEQVIRAYQFVFAMPPAFSVILMLAGVIVFVSGLRGSHHARAMHGKHVWTLVVGLLLFVVGFFPIISRMPQYWPKMQ